MNGWETKSLGDVLQLNYGKSLPVKKRVDGTVPVYGSNGIVGSHKQPIVNEPGLIVGRKGSAGQVHRSLLPFCPIDTTFYITASDAPDTDLEFLYYLLLHLDLKRIIGDVGVPGLNREMAYLEQVKLPPELSEQRKIAQVLSTVQRAIEEQERIIQTTTELKKALMQKFFTEGLRGESQKETEIGLVPESWEVVKLGDVINLFAGYAFKSKEAVTNSNTQLLRMGNLYQNNLDLKRKPIFYPDKYVKQHERFVLKEGDLVMSLTGTSGKEDYGFTVKLPMMERALLLNQRVTRIDIGNNRLQKTFAHYFLLSRKFLDFLYPTAKGMKQANLSTNAMKKLKIVLPDEQEQSEIAECFKSLDRKIAVATSKYEKFQDLFRTLLHELMTAKIRVDEIELPE
ncbi:MAG: restriction endonuclease subunit S, partial [Desulfocapsa sp.]|nr:restriction endonuclease subunit S [Desulfocapsa sp.]